MDRFERALEVVTQRLMDELGENLLGLLFGGSAAYGTPMRTSDLDLFVLIRPHWRQRRNELVEGVEVEMFINPVEQLRREIEERQPATVEMFARGRIHHDPTGVVAELAERAQHIASQPRPRPDGSETYFIRYRPSDLLRDAEDLLDVDARSAEFVLGGALRSVVEAHWLVRGAQPPKPKRVLERLRDEDPEAGRLAEEVLDVSLPLAHRVELLRRLCEHVLEPLGGVMLEGRTPPEPLSFDSPAH